MKIEIQGLDELIKGFSEMGSAQKVNRIIDKTLERKAKQIQAEARRNLTRLVYSKKETWYRRSGQLGGEGLSTEKVKNGWKVFDSMKYASHVEFGTGTLGDPSVSHTNRQSWSYKGQDGKFHTTHGMAPRPFLLPAFNKYKDSIPEQIRVDLSDELRRIIERNG